MRYNKNHIAKKIDDPLPPLPEDERIYFNVPYMAKYFAKYSHCGFDPEKKLWFTGSLNANLYALVRLYGVNKKTSEKAMQLLREEIGDISRQNVDSDESAEGHS